MTESVEVKEAIKMAIQMEKDGYAFYTKAAAQTSSENGSKIFEGLAKDELLHLEVFQDLFADEIEKAEYDGLVKSSQKYTALTVFPKDLKSTEGSSPDTNDIDALNSAMNAEKEAVDHYTEILEKTTDERVAEILKEIIHQEKQHYFILEEEFSFLGRTGYWYDLDLLSMED